MDAAVVVILVSLWAAILLPGLVRARRHGSPASSVSRFNGSMDLLERTSRGGTVRSPARSSVPPPRASARQWLMAMISERTGGRLTAQRADGRSTAQRAGGRWTAQRAGGRSASLASAPASTARARRRAVLTALSGLLAVALVSTPLLGAPAWVLSGVASVLLAAYIAGLRRLAMRRRLDRRVEDLQSARATRGGDDVPPRGPQAAAVGAGSAWPPVDGPPPPPGGARR